MTYPSSTLKVGDANDLVVKVKALLRSQGLWDGTSNNQFGPKLKAVTAYFQSTHVGPDGKHLEADGVIGEKTWWALYNPSGLPQKSHIDSAPSSADGFYGDLSQARKDFINVLLEEHRSGVAEIPDGSNGGDGVEKYLAGYGNVPWCSLCVSWAFRRSSGAYPFGQCQAHVQTFWQRAKEKGMAKLKSKYKPMPGDLMVWVFSGGTGHISAVVGTNANVSVVNTIGGNEGNRVKLGTRTIADEAKCVGFINLFGDSPEQHSWTKELFSAATVPVVTHDGSR